ncbi:DNA-binding protein [Bacteroidia bacterium]|nr:DNA-binding protein [Bacteroidia bacterium]
MNLNKEERKAVVTLRLQKAKETLLEAKDIVKLCHWRVVANRLYYACYYATSALLIKHGHMAQTHSGVISMLGLHFVKQGIVSNEQGKFYKRLFELRQTGDYDDWITIEEIDVQPLIAPAEEYICFLEKLIAQDVV